MWMNQSDIEWMASKKHACPNVRKGVKLIKALVDAVNAQSDGWAYWQAPGKSAEKLMDLLRTVGNLSYDTNGTITAKQLKDAVTPIRTMVTVQKKKQESFGNKFDFDVDAALGEEPKPAEKPETTPAGDEAQAALDKGFSARGRGKEEDAIDLFIVAMDKASEVNLPAVHRQASTALKQTLSSLVGGLQSELKQTSTQFN